MTATRASKEGGTLLEIDGLTICVEIGGRRHTALSDVSVSISKGEIVGVVGESGCGKSMMALAVMGLLATNCKILHGSIALQGEEIASSSQRVKARTRGAKVGMIFQEPMTALNPLMRVGRQIEEVLVIHNFGDRAKRKKRVAELLRQVGLANADSRSRQYPHELSGGMRQRVMIAIALAAEPALIIADEPTTALDATVQAQILDLLVEIRDRLGASVLLVTHDMGVVAETADRVIVMYAGHVVEVAPVRLLFAAPSHPYTVGLLKSITSTLVLKDGEDLPTIPGRVPSLEDIPKGCPFAPRCSRAQEKCVALRPPLLKLQADHDVACWFPYGVSGAGETSRVMANKIEGPRD